MAPRTTDFKTYEAQARLLAALVATLGEKFKFDFKTIAQHYGGGASESAMEHRFRPIRIWGEFAEHAVADGKDPHRYNFPAYKTKDEIQQHFGASTPDGVNFKWRSVKRGADVLKNAVANGEDPVAAFSAMLGNGNSNGNSNGTGGVVPATTTPKTPGSRKRARASKTTTPASTNKAANKRRKLKVESDVDDLDDDQDSPELDYEELKTPTLPPKKGPTPRKGHELLPKSAWAAPARARDGQAPVVANGNPARGVAPSNLLPAGSYSHHPATTGVNPSYVVEPALPNQTPVQGHGTVPSNTYNHHEHLKTAYGAPVGPMNLNMGMNGMHPAASYDPNLGYHYNYVPGSSRHVSPTDAASPTSFNSASSEVHTPHSAVSAGGGSRPTTMPMLTMPMIATQQHSNNASAFYLPHDFSFGNGNGTTTTPCDAYGVYSSNGFANGGDDDEGQMAYGGGASEDEVGTI